MNYIQFSQTYCTLVCPHFYIASCHLNRVCLGCHEGRPYPLDGEVYANAFVHFRPAVGWDYTPADIIDDYLPAKVTFVNAIPLLSPHSSVRRSLCTLSLLVVLGFAKESSLINATAPNAFRLWPSRIDFSPSVIHYGAMTGIKQICGRRAVLVPWATAIVAPSTLSSRASMLIVIIPFNRRDGAVRQL